MEVVASQYRGEGWKVTDVDLERPYDLVCTRGSTELHVEVKGKGGPAPLVELTRGEVDHVRACPRRHALAVVARRENPRSNVI